MGGGRLPVCSSNGHALWRRVWARWGREEQPGTHPGPPPLACHVTFVCPTGGIWSPEPVEN